MAARAIPLPLPVEVYTKSEIKQDRLKDDHEEYEEHDNNYFIYDIQINSAIPNKVLIDSVGKIKEKYLKSIIEEAIRDKVDHYSNKNAIKYLDVTYNYAANYCSSETLSIFDFHVIDVKNKNIGDNGDIVNIRVIFFVLKNEEYLIPKTIVSNQSIIMIFNRAIFNKNNLTNKSAHTYRQGLIIEDLEKKKPILNLSFEQPLYCKTPLYLYQRDTISWALNIENIHGDPENTKRNTKPFIKDKIIALPTLKMFFNYTVCSDSNPNPFIKFGDIPKITISSGIICDEPGLGKTIQSLNIVFYTDTIKTLIIVPNDNIKCHWIKEIKEHFIIPNPNDYLLLLTFDEFKKVDVNTLTIYTRVIVDELHEMYSLNSDNIHTFIKLLDMKHIKYRWGITGTPFIDNNSMYNIIRFILGESKLYYESLGNYIRIQNAFKKFMHRHCKVNVEKELHLPSVTISNILRKFSSYEQEIYDVEFSGNERNIQYLRELCCDVLMTIANNDKNTITPKELRRLTLDRFYDVYKTELDKLNSLEIKKQNVIEKNRQLLNNYDIDNVDKSTINEQYIIRIEDCDRLIEIQSKIVESRKIVYDRYHKISNDIEEIVSKIAEPKYDSDEMEWMNDDMDEIDYDKLCPICVSPFSSDIAFFISCKHYYCRSCFELAHKNAPNQCPTCRTIADIGEIVFVSNDDKKIIGTKNIEIIKLINQKKEKFIIFTQYDKFIKSVRNLLESNDIIAYTYNDYIKLSKELQDATQVIILSSTNNASGIDLSFIHNMIIVEPFDNLVYGREIEKQLIGRVHRIKQKSDVYVYRLIIEGTIEEHMY